MIDRRLADLELPCVQLLALIGRSRVQRWRVGNLVEMAAALGHDDGLKAVVQLLEAGLLYPYLGLAGAKAYRFRSIEAWLAQSADRPPAVIGLPDITARAMCLDVALPVCPGTVKLDKPIVHTTDGLIFPCGSPWFGKWPTPGRCGERKPRVSSNGTSNDFRATPPSMRR